MMHEKHSVYTLFSGYEHAMPDKQLLYKHLRVGLTVLSFVHSPRTAADAVSSTATAYPLIKCKGGVSKSVGKAVCARRVSERLPTGLRGVSAPAVVAGAGRTAVKRLAA